jgi:hypothetical protein
MLCSHLNDQPEKPLDNLETWQAQLLMRIYPRFSETDFMRKWITSICLMGYSDLDDFNEKYDSKVDVEARVRWRPSSPPLRESGCRGCLKFTSSVFI